MEWLFGLLPAIGDLFSGIFGTANTASTNAANLQIARETNAANAEQAQLAYERSKPVNQVLQMEQAGMSKPAALNKLAGGGVYTAPTMQGATMEKQDFSWLSNLGHSLSDMPANVQQRKLVNEQINDLKQQQELRAREEKRKQELHEFDVWQKQYGKDAATKLDAAQSLIMNKLLESGRELDSFRSYEDLVRSLGLQDAQELNHLPSIARNQLFDSVRDKFSEYREQHADVRADIESKDKHKISKETINKMREELKDFKRAADARNEEYDTRKAEAKLRAMAAEQGIALKELENTIKFYRDKDGTLKVHPVEGISTDVKEFWDVLFTFIPVKALAEILSNIFK